MGPSAASPSTQENEHTKGELVEPVEEKDQDELMLETSRASKLNQDTSVDDVRAPGVFQRVKEEVDAIVESIKEDHQNHKSSDDRVGCFSWLSFWGFNKHQ